MEFTNDIRFPFDEGIDLEFLIHKVGTVHGQFPASFDKVMAVGEALDLDPVQGALLLETAEQRHRDDSDVTPQQVWADLADRMVNVMFRGIRKGREGEGERQFLRDDWARRMGPIDSILGVGFEAVTAGIAVQEFNAGMGLVAAAPTGGAAGTLPGAIHAVRMARGADLADCVGGLLVGGMVGWVAFGRGPVSGAQAGCGGEVGVAASMAAGAVSAMLGGGWKEVAAAASLAAVPFVGLECAPSFGLVEYPCVPRNGAAAIWAIASAEMAVRAGIVPPYGPDETLDRVFAVGAALPACLRERENGHWMAGFMEETQQAQQQHRVADAGTPVTAIAERREHVGPEDV